jgi:hypothetical protein
MIDRLFVVVGAGASRGCAPSHVDLNPMWVPPLVTDLFEPHANKGISEILPRYPLAGLAAADLRGRDTSIAVEEFVRTRYRDSQHLAYYNPPEDLELDTDIVCRQSQALWETRGLSTEYGGYAHGSLFYPALSVPVGEEDELVCPPQHVDFLRERLAASQPRHLLLIGYSGNDREVLALVRESERGIKTLTVVDYDAGAAQAVVDPIASSPRHNC